MRLRLPGRSSWIGLVASVLYVSLSLVTPCFFYNPYCSKATRAAFLPVHVFSGMVAVALTMLSVPMGIMSWAYRGTGEAGTAHVMQGGLATTNAYKLASLMLTAQLLFVFLVFFVSEPGWANAKKTK